MLFNVILMNDLLTNQTLVLIKVFSLLKYMFISLNIIIKQILIPKLLNCI